MNTPQPEPRLFHLVRPSGTVAEGVEWSDGTVTLRWRGQWPVTSVWEGGVDAVLAVHGRHGAAELRWLAAGAAASPATAARPSAAVSPGVAARPSAVASPGAAAPPSAVASPGAAAPPGAAASPGVAAPPGAAASPGVAAPPSAVASPGVAAPPGAAAAPSAAAAAGTAAAGAPATTGTAVAPGSPAARSGSAGGRPAEQRMDWQVINGLRLAAPGVDGRCVSCGLVWPCLSCGP
jgi:hypothetical protein